MLLLVSATIISCVTLYSMGREVEVNELEFYNEEEDRKVDWSEVPPSSVRAMTRRIDRLCQIIKHMDDTVAETLMYLIEEEGEHVLDNMRVYCMGVNNLTEFIDEYTNITVHYGKSLLDRGPPKWIPAYFEPLMTFDRFNWTKNDLDRMYEMIDHAKTAYNSFATKLQEKM
ncbi:hypothetical protein J6590_026058 [Homalodisca vitripennis]|nr:hypothetical protein J6590_026058 [Homalodisca vitripennis]